MTRGAVLVVFGLATCFVSSVGGVAAAPVPKHLMKEPENPDLAALQGEWALTAIAIDGTLLPAETVKRLELTMEVSGAEMVRTVRNQDTRSTATLKFDPNAKPCRLTFVYGKVTDLKGNPKATDDKCTSSTAIYKIEGDTFTFAFRNGSGEAAEDFVGKPGSGTAVMMFTRVKK